MKEKKRRSTSCSNCGSQLEEEFNFCPICGQSNSDNNVTFSTLVKEFIDNYLGIDSKMAHSLIPFLIKPGALTKRFYEGKIKHFIHPIRLYFVMSLFYFFTISYLLSDFGINTFDDEDEYTDASLKALQENDALKSLSDSTKLSLVEDSVINQFSGIGNFSQLIDSLNAQDSEFIEDLTVSLSGIEIPKSDKLPFLERMHVLARDSRVQDSIFWDSLTSENDISGDFFSVSQKAHLHAQTRKIFKNDAGFKSFVLGNLPLMMFILIPLFAAILKLIYIRRKHLYIKHVVHALHIHSFAYLVYGLGLLIMFKLITDEGIGEDQADSLRAILGITFFVIASTYAYISFLKVYQQGWFKTLVKFNIVGFIYAFFLQVFFYAEIFISFWYY